MQKRFSIKLKLLIIFGCLITVSVFILGFLAMQLAKKAVREKVEVHLTDKATDTAEVIDGRINAFFQFLEGVARAPILRNPEISYREKLAYLKKEAGFRDDIRNMDLCDMNGVRYAFTGTTIFIGDRNWYLTAKSGTDAVSEPLISRLSGNFITVFAVPVYDDNRNIVNVLVATADAKWLTNIIADITVGKTGYCYVLGLTGTTIGIKDFDRVQGMENTMKLAETDKNFVSVSAFEKMAMETDKSSVGFYEYKGVNKIASYARMQTTSWTVIITAPITEFMGTIQVLRKSMYGLGVVILLIVLVIVFFSAYVMIKPISTVVSALKDIAQGEGDLTVRLPVHGNDEITDLSSFLTKQFLKSVRP